MICEQGLYIGIWPWVFTELVLPIQTAEQSIFKHCVSADKQTNMYSALKIKEGKTCIITCLYVYIHTHIYKQRNA